MSRVPSINLPRVSDHALVRWLERVRGWDMEPLRAEILTAERVGHILQGASRLHLPVERATLIVSDLTIVTVVPLDRSGWR